MSHGQTERPFSILIAYDGSDCARAAIRDLSRAALPAEGTAFVVSVAETADAGATFSYGDIIVGPTEIARFMSGIKDAAAHIAREGAELVRSVLPRWRVDGQAPEGTAYWTLLDHADRHEVDLIVVGSHGRGAIGRLMLGSTSQFVVTHARCSVHIGRCKPDVRAPAEGPPRILVAIDGSPSSDAAVDAIAARAWQAGTECHLFMALELGVSVAIQSRATREPNLARVDTPAAALHYAADKLRDSGLVVTTKFRPGNPKLAILEEARERGTDLIFVGAQGHSRLARLCFGSVSAAVAARAECSVEVVRPRVVPQNGSIAGDQVVAARTPTKELSCC